LAPGLNDGLDRTSVFVRDLSAGKTTLVSVTSQGAAAWDPAVGASLSGDGNLVAFDSGAYNLQTMQPNTNSRENIYLHDRTSGSTILVNVPIGPPQYASCLNPSLSADGRYVAFYASAGNLVANFTPLSSNIVVRDLLTMTASAVSRNASGEGANAENGAIARISANGRYVIFDSLATNLVERDTNSASDVFVAPRP
jgi:Tol biopolymer transport system component